MPSETASLTAGRRSQTGLHDHLVDPLGGKSLGMSQPQQVVAGGAAGLQRGRIQQGADVRQRLPEAAVRLPPDQGGARVGRVQAEDHPHRG
jgi:hypothetical protein